MASSEAVLRLRPELRVASERPHFGLYLMEKNDLDQDNGLGYIRPFVKNGKRPCVLIEGTLYYSQISNLWSA